MAPVLALISLAHLSEWTNLIIQAEDALTDVYGGETDHS